MPSQALSRAIPSSASVQRVAGHPAQPFDTHHQMRTNGTSRSGQSRLGRRYLRIEEREAISGRAELNLRGRTLRPVTIFTGAALLACRGHETKVPRPSYISPPDSSDIGALRTLALRRSCGISPDFWGVRPRVTDPKLAGYLRIEERGMPSKTSQLLRKDGVRRLGQAKARPGQIHSSSPKRGCRTPCLDSRTSVLC